MNVVTRNNLYFISLFAWLPQHSRDANTELESDLLDTRNKLEHDSLINCHEIEYNLLETNNTLKCDSLVKRNTVPHFVNLPENISLNKLNITRSKARKLKRKLGTWSTEILKLEGYICQS